MQRELMPPLVDGKLPVFVFPTSLNFYSDDQSSYKQVLTLYNPYDFTLKFKVLCTAPKKYNVVDSEGTIKARCCVDIVVRHKDICINNEGIRNKFRINVTEFGQKTVIGRKDIQSVLLPTRDKTEKLEETFESLALTVPMSTSGRDSQHNFTSKNFRGANGTGPSWIIVVAAILCITALMVPTHGEKESRLPDYLTLSSHQKLIAAYILGLVTMAILRST